jgi:outer membrane protein insertion porin family
MVLPDESSTRRKSNSPQDSVIVPGSRTSGQRAILTRTACPVHFGWHWLPAVLAILLVWPLVTPSAQGASSSRLIIERVSVEGNSYFSADKIKDQMMLKENRWYNFLRKRRFNPKRAELDKAAIDSLYHVHGFLQAECSVEPVEKTESTCWVKVQVTEGIQTRLGTVAVEGGLAELGEKTRKEMRSLKTGDPLDWTKLYEAAFDIKTLYANGGYPYAEVKIAVSPGNDPHALDVTFGVTPDKKVYFGKVTYQGLQLTHENVARRELTIKEGEIYSRAKIIDSQQRIYSTGLFNYISLKAQDVEQKPAKPDFVLRVVEKKPYYTSIRTELAQNQPLTTNQQEYLTVDFTGEWGNRNLFGTSSKIGLSAYYGFKVVPEIERLANRFTARYVQPWFLGTRTVFDFDLYYEPGVKSTLQEYRIQTYGGNLNLSRDFSKSTKLWFTGTYQQVKIYSIPPEKLETYKEEQGISIQRKVRLWGENDTRANIFIPLDGSFTQMYTEYVGGLLGGDNSYFKTGLAWSRYNHLGKGSSVNVLATHAEFGYITGLGRKDEVPTFDRFYMGGASTMRGFKENSMGPKDAQGDPAGGLIMILGNIEYRRELFWKLGYTLFVDAGNLWGRIKQVRLDSFKLSAGLGLQFFTPVGPLRIDYGRQLPIKKSPATGRFHLSILYAF